MTVNAELTSSVMASNRSLSARKPGESEPAWASQQLSVSGMRDCHVLFCILVNLFAFASRPHGGPTVTHGHLFVVVLLCLLCPHPSAIAASHLPKQTIVSSEKRFQFGDNYSERARCQNSFGRWMMKVPDWKYMILISRWLCMRHVFLKEKKNANKTLLNMSCGELSWWQLKK